MSITCANKERAAHSVLLLKCIVKNTKKCTYIKVRHKGKNGHLGVVPAVTEPCMCGPFLMRFAPPTGHLQKLGTALTGFL